MTFELGSLLINAELMVAVVPWTFAFTNIFYVVASSEHVPHPKMFRHYRQWQKALAPASGRITNFPCRLQSSRSVCNAYRSASLTGTTRAFTRHSRLQLKGVTPLSLSVNCIFLINVETKAVLTKDCNQVDQASAFKPLDYDSLLLS